jgi:hypothetical protein
LGNPVIEPGTGFTTKPGVAALRRTAGSEIGSVLYPNGVLQTAAMPERKAESVPWNPVGVQIRVHDLSWGAPLSQRRQALL